jgi:hypothetical protein
MEEKFTTKVESPTITGFGKFLGVADDVDVEVGNPTVTVEWVFYLESREWGIKSISAVATKLTTSIEWSAYTEDMSEEDKAKLIAAGGFEHPKREWKDGYIEGIYEFDSGIKIGDKPWTIESEISTDGGQISPDDCGIDFNDMSIYVN